MLSKKSLPTSQEEVLSRNKCIATDSNRTGEKSQGFYKIGRADN